MDSNLWTDGNLYPCDPLTGAAPPFRNITQLVRFVGDGFNGFLGYCGRLHAAHTRSIGALQALLQEGEQLKQRIADLTKEVGS